LAQQKVFEASMLLALPSTVNGGFA